MSKHLIKILSICAFVVLLPLAIVGVALCVTETRPCKLTVYEAGATSNFGVKSGITISIGGEEQKDSEGKLASSVTVMKNTEITVTFNGEGYDFVGWYNGTDKEVTGTGTKASDKASYTFYIRGNTNLSAYRNILTYNVVYDGLYNDESPITRSEDEVEYGEQLMPLTPKGEDTTVVFDGWYVKDSTSTEGTHFANFAKTDAKLELRPDWSNQMTITYYAADKTTVIGEDKVSQGQLKNTYELIAATDTRVVNNTNKGYSFDKWVDINGDPVDIKAVVFSAEGLKVYMAEKQNSYAVDIQASEVDTTIQTIEFNMTKMFSDFLPEERLGYTFKGFMYNERLYTFDETSKDYKSDALLLSSAVVESEEKITLVAVWECKVQNLTVNVRAMMWNEETHGYLPLYYLDGSEYKVIAPVERYVIFEDSNLEGCYDLEDKIFENFFSGVDITALYVKQGEEYKAVKLSEISYSDNRSLADDATLAGPATTDQTFLQMMYDKINDETFKNVNKVNIDFLFVRAPETAE